MIGGRRLRSVLILAGIFLGMVMVGELSAQEVVAELSSPAIALDEQVTLTVRITGAQSTSEPELPSLQAFNVYTTGRTFQSTYVNGQMTSYVEYSYILIPKQTGKFLIGPIKVAIKGKTFQTQALALEVRPAAQQAPPQGGRSQTSGGSQSKYYIISAEIDHDTVYEGEQVVYSFKAFQRRGASFLSAPIYLPPSFAGFWREDFGFRRYSRTIGGVPYVVSELNSYLFPTRPGDVTVDPTRVVVVPDDFSSFFNFDPFDSRGLRQRRLRSEPETLYTKPVIIAVLPLPRENRPADFKGSVGDFNMKAELSDTQVSVDETILLTIRISGRGNIKTLSPPDIPDIEGLDIKSSGDSTSVREEAGAIAGYKIFEFSMIPERDGVFELPPLKWSYFDPRAGTYKTHRSEAHTIVINPGQGREDLFTGTLVPKGDLRARDILGIAPLTGKLHSYSRPLILSPAFLALQAVPLAAVAGVIIVKRRRARLMGDVRYRRLKRAHSLARQRLSRAQRLLISGHHDQFFGEISKTLYEYIGDKFNCSAAGLTESRAREILAEHGYPDNLGEGLGEIIKAADFARFAPVETAAETAHRLLDQAMQWIIAAEQEGRRVK